MPHAVKLPWPVISGDPATLTHCIRMAIAVQGYRWHVGQVYPSTSEPRRARRVSHTAKVIDAEAVARVAMVIGFIIDGTIPRAGQPEPSPAPCPARFSLGAELSRMRVAAQHDHIKAGYRTAPRTNGNNRRCKLTDEQAMRAKCHVGTLRGLAREFGVSSATLEAIRRGNTYRWLVTSGKRTSTSTSEAA